MQDIHNLFCCDNCNCSPIIGIRYKCKTCQDYDLCQNCYNTKNTHPHEFVEIKKPIPNLQPPSSTIHQTIQCDGCDMFPLVGNRYKCQQCADFDLCQKCYQVFPHDKSHNFLPIDEKHQVTLLQQVAQSNQLLFAKQPEVKKSDSGTFRLFGFFEKRNSMFRIPLKTIFYQAEINNSIAKTSISQTYINESDKYIETEFLFPIESKACFDRFEARFQNQIIRGVIKEKEEAKEEYKKNLQQGNTTAYSEIYEDAPDVMKIDIGNIPPHTEVQIMYSYLQELEVTLNSFWRYAIPSTLTPRYNENTNYSNNESPNITTMNQNSQNAYTWSIQIKLQQSSKIESIDSPSHKLLLLQQNQDKTEMEITVENIEKQLIPNKDFILIFRNEQIRVPSVTLGRGSDNQICAMLTFIPNFANCQMNDALKQSIQGGSNDFPIDLDAARSEYIFLIDRSGSMSGDRIEYAKEALIFFLKSMPNDCYFNIISFGDKFSSMFSGSVKYQQDKLKEAIKKVEQFQASFGGTQIYQPLYEIFNMERKKQYPRQVFLLTDGEVSNPQKVIELIQQNNQFNRVYFIYNNLFRQVHSIGIGNGASTYLVKNCAKSGKGNYTFVQNPGDISGSIIKMLEQSLTPCLDNFVFTYEKNLIDMIIPAPSMIPFILKNEPFCIYVFFKPDVQQINTEIVLSCYDSSLNENLEFPIHIDSNNCHFRNEVYKLGMSKMIKCLEDETYQTRSKEVAKDAFQARFKNLKSQLVQLSVRHQIISTKTAFICVMKTVIDEMAPLIQSQQNLEKIIIPSIESVDYSLRAPSTQINMSYAQCIPKSSSKLKCLSFGGSRGGRGGRRTRQAAGPRKNQQEMKFCCDENIQNYLYDEDEEEEKMECLKNIQQDMEIESKFYPVQPNSNVAYKQVIDEFQLEGYWKANKILLANITNPNIKIDTSMPPEIKQFNKAQDFDIWMTIIILTWLQLKQTNQKNEWTLIEKKVLNWLKKVTNDTWKQFQQTAESVLSKN